VHSPCWQTARLRSCFLCGFLAEGFDAQAAGWSYVTPEPSALLLALLGLGLLPWRRRRRR